MAEADVVLTDYALALECTVLAWRSGRATSLARWSSLLFLATAVTTLAGGTSHGFRPGARVLWIVAMLGTGVIAFAAWGAGACLVASPRAVRTIVALAAVELAAYSAAVAGGAQTFRFAIANYLAASVFLLAGFAVATVRYHERTSLAGIAGLAGTLVAAGMQQARVALPVLSLDHNALFHVVQGASLALLFLGFRRLEGRAP
jgi:uncharacterized protein DUF6962